MQRFERAAGENQKIVVYVTDDTGGGLDPAGIFEVIGADATALDADGWRIVSTTAMPLRQMGTAGNIFFQSGGQFATQAAIAVVYARA